MSGCFWFARRSRPGAPDCLRECGKPIVGQSHGPPAGNCGAIGVGRGKGACDSPNACREHTIALAGGGFGALIAIGGVKGSVALLPVDFPRADAIHVNAPVFVFTLIVALATGFVFGLAPALQASRTDLQHGLREGGRGATSSGRHHGCAMFWL